MHAMQESWDAISFNTCVYRETGVHILSAVDDIQAGLDDQLMKTQTMRGSPFIKPFDKEIRVRRVFFSPIFVCRITPMQ